jgi:outer membrane receptor protein involved in Fe transport
MMTDNRSTFRIALLIGTTALGSAPALAQQAPSSPSQDAQNAQDEQSQSGIPDIIVTATKRPESVRDISGSVSAFDESQLEALGANSLEDYLSRTPGVVFNAAVPGDSSAIIRGIATTTTIAQAQGTTGYFIDDVPLTDPFYSAGIPDIDTFDVDNVTILRGPQGPLFGSASLGGAINYQAARPDLDDIDMHFRGTIEDSRRGEMGFGAHAMVNLPIAPGRFAVRGVIEQRRDGGYVDNVGTGAINSNQTRITGGRLLATWQPAAGTTINYLFLDQTERTDDAGSAQRAVGDYAKDSLVAEPFRFRTNIHNLRLDQDLGFATLTATGTYHAKHFSSIQDYSGLVPALAPVSFDEGGRSRGSTFEVRLASPTGARFEYLIGAYHDATNERIVDALDAPAAVPIFGAARLLEAPVNIRGRESALFGEATWHFTDQFKATFGGRLFRTRLHTTTTQSGPFVGATVTTEGGSRETGFSPKASLTWQPDEDHLVYALVSKGFRFGGPNIAVDPTFAIPGQFNSDSLVNYEIGARSSFLDRRLQLDGTLFYVDWNDIQVTQTSPGGFTYTANAGKARSQGLEGNVRFMPTRALTLQAGVTYLDAELRRDFGSGAALVPKGSRLPGASRWQVSDSITYALRDSAAAPTLLLSHRYISAAPGELSPAPAKQGGYNLFDLRLSARFDRIGVAAFIENIGDVRGVSQAATGVRGPVEFLVRPRTIGLTLDYRL